MSKLSFKKIDKIKQDILSLLFETSPKPLYTYNIAEELARDDEFIKRLLQELEKNKLVMRVERSNNGIKHIRKKRWKLTQEAYKAYKDLV